MVRLGGCGHGGEEAIKEPKLFGQRHLDGELSRREHIEDDIVAASNVGKALHRCVRIRALVGDGHAGTEDGGLVPLVEPPRTGSRAVRANIFGRAAANAHAALAVIVWIDPLLFLARQAVNARELGRSASKVMIEAVVLYIKHHEVRDWRRHQTEKAQHAEKS